MFKKIGTFAMACIMALSVVTTAGAAGVEKSPLVDTSKEGSITIHKYDVGHTGDFTWAGNGLEIGEDDEINDEGTTLKDLTPLGNISFTIVKVKDGATSPDDAEVITGTGSFNKTITTNDNGVAEQDKLPVGIYLITEVPNSAVEEPCDPFLVSIPMTDPLNGDNWIYDVHVYPKNQTIGDPGIDKFVTELENKHDTVDWYQNVKWIITTEIPKDIATCQYYKVDDQIDQVFQYVLGSMEIYFISNVDPADVEYDPAEEDFRVEDDKRFLVSGVHYEMNGDTSTNMYSASLTKAGMEYIDKYIDFDDFTDLADDEMPLLYTEFETKFIASKEELEELLGEPIYNGATISYKNAANVEYESDVEDEPEVHTGGVKILKVDGNNNDILLSGAKFKIYRSLEDAQAGENAVVNPLNQEEEWEVTTDDDGVATFYGLSYGILGQENDDPDAKTSYWIVETQAPKDENGKYYNLLKKPMEVTVSAESHLEENQVIVENKIGFTLPSTGGMGTFLFTLIGIVLIGISAYTFYAAKKKRNA